MIDSSPHPAAPADLSVLPPRGKPRVLYVDDEPENLRVFKYMFREWFEVATAASGMEALELMEIKPFDVIISDQRMPNMTGVDLLELVAERFPTITRMILTGYSDISSVIAAINRGRIYFYIEKPWKEAEIRLVVANAMEALQLRTELEARERELAVAEKLAENNLRLEKMVQERTADLQRSEEELKHHRDNLQDLVDVQTKNIKAIVDTAADGIITIDQHGNILSFNAAAERIFGFKVSEAIGQHASMLMPTLDSSMYDKYIGNHSATEAGKVIGVGQEVAARHRDGSTFPAHLALSVVEVNGEKHFTGILRDISVQKETERALIQARESAEAANFAKSAFLATMSHEIRTPMNGIIGTLEVLRRASLTLYQTELVDTIGDSSTSLLTLIDDILDFSKIEAGKLELESEPLSLASLVERVGNALQPVADHKQVDMFIHADPSLPDWILGDSVRLRQILNNLLSNAIKFSARGKVRVRAVAAGLNSVQLIVADNGIGIAPEALEKLFIPFTQAESSTTRHFGGSGLGLVICRRLVDMMGGRITVKSALGQGTTVTVSLPVTVDTTQPPLVAGPDLSGLKCFIVTQDAECGQDWATYLNHAGADAQIFSDLDTARRQLLSLPGGPMVLILGKLPQGMALARMRASLDIQSELGIVVITGGTRRRPRLLADGSGGIVLLDGDNPYRASLLQAVALAASRVVPEDNDESQPVPPPDHWIPPSVDEAITEGRLILVAEDNNINQKVIRRQLALLGYAAEIAEDGSKALALWRTGRHGLLLTDLHMPEMDGYELTAAIRKEEEEAGAGQHRPIIALTANAMKGEELRCKEAGMDAYLSKPVLLNSLQTTLEKWLPLAVPREKRTISRAIGGSAVVHELPVLDQTVLEKLVGNDAAMITEFIGDYCSSAQQAGEEIRSALAGHDWKTVGAGAHKLKSSSRSVGALALGDVCARLEKASKGGDAKMMASLATEFENILAAVIDAIDQRPR